MMTEEELQRINELTLKAKAEMLSAEEQLELNQWLDAHPLNRALYEDRITNERIWEGLVRMNEGDELKDQLRNRIVLPKDTTKEKPVLAIMWRRSIAAAVILLIGAGIFLIVNRRHGFEEPQAMTTTYPDILPGGNRAILTLGDGRKIDLDSSKSGVVASQGSSQVRKLANGQIAYEKGAGTSGTDKKLVYNTLAVPRGGQYQLSLPDGTKVWLNAASSITYPTEFIGKERKVEVTGEIYFDAARKTGIPFVVKTPSTNIQVLGTDFNIRAYPDEKDEKITLIEGAVKVSSNKAAVILRPGEQAAVTADQIAIDKVDTDNVIAWKDGYFQYSSAPIERVMNDLSRWYNVKVKFSGETKGQLLSARVSRQASADDLIEILKASGYKFKIAGKTIEILQ